MDAMEMLLTRKCVRKYTGQKVTDEQIASIILAGTRAPSGMANEPWRFAVIRSTEVKGELAKLTKYTDVLNAADALICLFFDTTVGYNAMKDANTMGACAENMLLAAHALGLGAVWIAEILKNQAEASKLCDADPERYQLMMVMPVGHSAENSTPNPRKHTVEELILSRK